MKSVVFMMIWLGLYSNVAFAGKDSDACNNFLDSADYQRAIESGKKAVRNKPKEVGGYLCLGRTYNQKGEYPTAIAILKKGEKLTSVKKDLGSIASSLGIAYSNTGDKEEALRQYQRGLALNKDLGDEVGIGTALSNIALIYQDKGDLEHARQLMEESLPYPGKDSNIRARYNNLALLYDDLGNKDKCIEYLVKSVEIGEKSGDYHGTALSRLNRGNTYREQGKFDEARTELGEGLIAIMKTGDRDGEATAYTYLARLSRDSGNIPDARSYFKKALAIFEQIGAKDWVASINASLSKLD